MSVNARFYLWDYMPPWDYSSPNCKGISQLQIVYIGTFLFESLKTKKNTFNDEICNW